MSSRDDSDKQKRQWGQDDGYDERNYTDVRAGQEDQDPYDRDGVESYDESAFGGDEFYSEEGDAMVDDHEVERITKDIMEREFPGLDSPRSSKKDPFAALNGLAYVGCAQIAVMSGIQGVILGSVLGAVQTGFSGAAQGLFRQPGFGRFVFQQAKLQGKQFGIWLTCFTGMKCTLTFARGGKQDILTVFGSGFFAGSLSTLYSRNPPLIAMNGLGSGVIVSVLHLVGFGL